MRTILISIGLLIGIFVLSESISSRGPCIKLTTELPPDLFWTRKTDVCFGMHDDDCPLMSDVSYNWSGMYKKRWRCWPKKLGE